MFSKSKDNEGCIRCWKYKKWAHEELLECEKQDEFCTVK